MNTTWTGKDKSTLAMGDQVSIGLGPRADRIFVGEIMAAEPHRLGGTVVTLKAADGEEVRTHPEWCSAHAGALAPA